MILQQVSNIKNYINDNYVNNSKPAFSVDLISNVTDVNKMKKLTAKINFCESISCAVISCNNLISHRKEYCQILF